MNDFQLPAGESREFTIPKGDMVGLTLSDDGSFSYWWVTSDRDDIRGGGIEGTGSISLGPYIADARLRVQCASGVVIVENNNPVLQEPRLLREFVGGMSGAQLDAIAGLTPASSAADIVAALQAE